MSEYYLADHKAEERAHKREFEHSEERSPTSSQNVKVTLLGDFMFPSGESHGCDPYNSVHGATAREPWRARRAR